MKFTRTFFALRPFTLGVVGAFVFTHVVYLHGGEISFWEERREATGRAAPFDNSRGLEDDTAGDPRFRALAETVLPFGHVRSIFESKRAGAPLVLHIQDVHGNLDVQRNMAEMVLAIARTNGVRLVGLEGAAGPFATEEFKSYPDPTVLPQVAAYFMKKGVLGGPEVAGLRSEVPITLWGVEDPRLYRTNVRAVKQSLAARPQAQAFLNSLTQSLHTLKKLHYTDALRDFDENQTRFEQGTIGLGDFVETVARFDGSEAEKRMEEFPNVARFLACLKMESALDVAAVEKQRGAVAQLLAGRISPHTIAKTSLSAQGSLRDLCERNGIRLGDYPDLDRSLLLLDLRKEIEWESLLNELTPWENSIQNTLAQTEPQRAVVELCRDALILRRLLSNAMTPGDWKTYLSRRGEILRLHDRLDIIPREKGRNPAPAAGLMGVQLAPFESFCATAMKRNKSLAEGLLRKMDREKQPMAILVAGGFHTEGLIDILGREGASVMVVTPKMGREDSEQHYLNVLAKQPLPLEMIFTGEPISLKAECGLANEKAVQALHFAIVAFTLFNKWKTEKLNLKTLRRFLIELTETRPYLSRLFWDVKIDAQGILLSKTDPKGKHETLRVFETNSGDIAMTLAKTVFYGSFIHWFAVNPQNLADPLGIGIAVSFLVPGMVEFFTKVTPTAEEESWTSPLPSDQLKHLRESLPHLIDIYLNQFENSARVRKPTVNDPRSLAELPPGILVCVLEDTEFYITIGEGPDFERWLKFQTAGLKKVKGIPHTVQMVDSSLDNPVKTSRPYLITIAVPGRNILSLGTGEDETASIVSRILSFPSEHINELTSSVLGLLEAGYTIDGTRGFHVYYDPDSGFALGEVVHLGAPPFETQDQLFIAAKELVARLISAGPRGNDLGAVKANPFFKIGLDRVDKILSENGPDQSAKSDPLALEKMDLLEKTIPNESDARMTPEPSTPQESPLASSSEEDQWAFPEASEPQQVPRVLPVDRLVAHRKPISLSDAVGGREPANKWWELRRVYRNTGLPVDPIDVRRFRRYLRQQVKEYDGTDYSSPLVASVAWNKGLSAIDFSSLFDDDIRPFEQRLRAWVLAESWLASASVFDRFRWRYWVLRVREWSLFGHWRFSTQDRVGRAAILTALLRARGSSVLSSDKMVTGNEAAQGLDIDLLLGACASSPGKISNHFHDLKKAYNGFLEQVTRVRLWRERASLLWSTPQTNGESETSAPGASAAIIFDLDALMPSARVSEESQREVADALMGILALPASTLKKNVILVTSRHFPFSDDKPLAGQVAVLLEKRFGPSMKKIDGLQVIAPVKKFEHLFIERTGTESSFRGDYHTKFVSIPYVLNYFFNHDKPASIEFWTHDESLMELGNESIHFVNILKLAKRIQESFIRYKFIQMFA